MPLITWYASWQANFQVTFGPRGWIGFPTVGGSFLSTSLDPIARKGQVFSEKNFDPIISCMNKKKFCWTLPIGIIPAWASMPGLFWKGNLPKNSCNPGLIFINRSFQTSQPWLCMWKCHPHWPLLQTARKLPEAPPKHCKFSSCVAYLRSGPSWIRSGWEQMARKFSESQGFWPFPVCFLFRFSCWGRIAVRKRPNKFVNYHSYIATSKDPLLNGFEAPEANSTQIPRPCRRVCPTALEQSAAPGSASRRFLIESWQSKNVHNCLYMNGRLIYILILDIS